MSYRPEERMLAYLYGELDGQEKEEFEHYLLLNPQVSTELENLRELRKMMGSVKDKEVIAPIFVDSTKRNLFWSSPYLKTIVGIAASLLILVLVARIVDVRIVYSQNQFIIGFGGSSKLEPASTVPQPQLLNANEVQSMINTSLQQNNLALQSSLAQSQRKLDVSIQSNLAMNSNKIDQLVQKASMASQEQIQSFVATLQNENTKLVKNYFQLTAADQKKYIEDLLIDFAKYMQQQRNNDMQIVQTRLNSLEKNTDLFKHETEQILSSIITTGSNTKLKGIKN